MTGEKLKNGAVELLRKETNNEKTDVVLAVFGHQFVIWDIDKQGVTRSGDYYDDLQRALDAFNKRN